MVRWISSLCLLMALTPVPAAAAEAPPSPKPGGTRPYEGPPQVTHMISLALVVAGNDASGGLEPAPAVAKAIADIKEFLPYKRYEVQDTEVMRTANRTATRLELAGPEARYMAAFQYQMSEDERTLNFQQFVLVRSSEPAEAPHAPGTPLYYENQPTPAASSREMISTAFSVNVGETIVVGTSRLSQPNGKALVLVLTVLPAR